MSRASSRSTRPSIPRSSSAERFAIRGLLRRSSTAARARVMVLSQAKTRCIDLTGHRRVRAARLRFPARDSTAGRSRHAAPRLPARRARARRGRQVRVPRRSTMRSTRFSTATSAHSCCSAPNATSPTSTRSRDTGQRHRTPPRRLRATHGRRHCRSRATRARRTSARATASRLRRSARGDREPRRCRHRRHMDGRAGRPWTPARRRGRVQIPGARCRRHARAGSKTTIPARSTRSRSPSRKSCATAATSSSCVATASPTSAASRS